MIFFLLVITATFQPAAPTVGDPITIDFGAPIVLDRSDHYEIVSQRGSIAVIRSFQPQPFAISGKAGGTYFRNMIVPMRSVLKPNDGMEPAPLEPPIKPAWPRGPFVAMGAAAGLAALLWAAVILLDRKRAAASLPVPSIPPADRFRAAVESLRRNPRAPNRWARLADETRIYLASLAPELGTELTSTELLSRFGGAPVVAAEGGSAPQAFDSLSTIAQILQQGDLEKFSPWGPPHREFDSLAAAALNLIPEEPEEKAA